MEKRYYPPPVSGTNGLLYAIAFGLFIGFFLWFFEPFDLDSDGYSSLQILFFGVISFFVLLFFHVLLPLSIPSLFQEKKWTIGSQIIFYGVILFAIATLNGLYINFMNELKFSWSNYGFIIVRTVVLGLIPISMYVLLIYYWKNQESALAASTMTKLLAKPVPPVKAPTIAIKTDIKNETFLLPIEDFLFAKADGNYTEIYTRDRKKRIYRLNLSAFTKQLADYEQLLRCHRSYLVNGNKIVKATGNAQGLQLWLEKQESVPVSRKYIPKIKAYLEESA